MPNLPEIDSTNKINNILKGQQLQINGANKTVDGNSRFTFGAVCLNTLGLLMYTNPATTTVGSVAYAAFWGFSAYSIISGTFKEVEGRQESQLGQEITSQALRVPDYAEASNVFIFRPATPVSKAEPTPEMDIKSEPRPTEVRH